MRRVTPRPGQSPLVNSTKRHFAPQAPRRIHEVLQLVVATKQASAPVSYRFAREALTASRFRSHRDAARARPHFFRVFDVEDGFERAL